MCDTATSAWNNVHAGKFHTNPPGFNFSEQPHTVNVRMTTSVLFMVQRVSVFSNRRSNQSKTEHARTLVASEVEAGPEEARL